MLFLAILQPPLPVAELRRRLRDRRGRRHPGDRHRVARSRRGIRGDGPARAPRRRRHRRRRRPGRSARHAGTARTARPSAATVIERVRVPTDLPTEIASVPVSPTSSPTSRSRRTSSWTASRSPVRTGRRRWATRGRSAAITPFALTEGAAPDADRRDRARLRAGPQRPVSSVDDQQRRPSSPATHRRRRPSPGSPSPPSGGSRASSRPSSSPRTRPPRYYGARRPGRPARRHASPTAPTPDTVAVAIAGRPSATSSSVLTGDERGQAEFLDASESSIRLIAISGSLGGIALFVAALVLAGMITLFVQQRQREIALLRAIGATPRQVRRLLARETLTVTAAGRARRASGPASGSPACWPSAMQDKGLLPGTFEVQTGIWPPVAAVVAGARWSARWRRTSPAVGRAGSGPSRRSRTRPVRPAGIGWLRAVAGVLCAGGTARSVPRGDVGPGVHRTGAGPGHVDGRRAHGRAVRPDAGRGRRTACVGPRRSAACSVPAGSSRSPTSGHQVRRVASAVIPLALTVGVAGMTSVPAVHLGRASRRAQRDDRVDGRACRGAGCRRAVADRGR